MNLGLSLSLRSAAASGDAPEEPPPEGSTPADVLGSRLLIEFTDDFDGTVYTDDINGQLMGRASGGTNPTVSSKPGFLTWPGGAGDYLHGADASVSPNTALAPLAAMPAFGGAGAIGTSGQRMHFCAFRIDALDADYQHVYAVGNTTVHINPSSGVLAMDDNNGGYNVISSDDPIVPNDWYRAIFVSDDATSTLRMYVNGVLQADVGAFRVGDPASWGGYGPYFGGGWDGDLRIGFAYTATGFSSQDIEDLDAALLAIIEA
jgi:hypothetical protein